MTDFEKFGICFKKTMGNEGFYSNNPNDSGGETFCGISRNNFPDWDGWLIIDGYKKTDKNWKDVIRTSRPLMDKVKYFYYKEFWLKNKCDLIANQSITIANELFDTSVNMGLIPAAKILQQALNLLNKNQKLYPDLTVDGKIGNLTLDSLKTLLKQGSEEEYFFYQWMNFLQASQYIAIMIKKPSQEEFARGWLKRVIIEKDNMNAT